MTSEAKEPVLKPASDNPWYVLATVCGEQTGREIDWDLHARNRRIWNGWACYRLKDEEREALAKRLGIDAADLMPWGDAEWDAVNGKFDGSFQSSGKLSFYRTELPQVCFQGFIFPKSTDFNKARFTGNANFRGAAFLNQASFNEAEFCGCARFTETSFEYAAHYYDARFRADAYFNRSRFKGPARFDRVRFAAKVPAFYDATFRQDTRFPLAYSHWPGITRENATDAKEAYAALRLAMEDMKKVEDAQFFARQELRCKARSEDWFTGMLLAAYGVFSDFGHSVGRPLLWLVGFGILFAFAYAAAFLPSGLISGEQTYGGAVQSCLAGDGCMPFLKGAGLSAVSSFPFLGGKALHFGKALVEGPAWLGVLTGIQTTIAIALLFLFGLALRNRFRLR